jgi:hypothetical protein
MLTRFEPSRARKPSTTTTSPTLAESFRHPARYSVLGAPPSIAQFVVAPRSLPTLM